MAKPEHNAAYEARQRERGMVRGPRISGRAADRLRTLCYERKMTPSQLVSALILGELGEKTAVPDFQHRERLSAEEVAFARSLGYHDPD